MSEHQKYTPQEIRRQRLSVGARKVASVGIGLLSAQEGARMTSDFMANRWIDGTIHLGWALWFGGIALKTSCETEEARSELYNMESHQTEMPPRDEL